MANYITTKLYYVIIITLYGLLLYFKPFKEIPFQLRVILLVGYLLASLYAEDWYVTLLISYAGMFGLVLMLKMFEERTYRYFSNESRQFILTKTFVIVSLACAFPSGIKSHLNNTDT